MCELNIVRRWEFGQLPFNDDAMAARISEAEGLLDVNHSREHLGKCLAPDWKKQSLRSVVPCLNAGGFQWRRVCYCVTLGRLFAVLGQDYSAAVLYHFYRARRIVVAKKRKC